MYCICQASKLPAVLDRAWTTIGGGPADLFFPEEFLGTWDVASTLVKVDLPFGPEFVPDLRVNAQGPCMRPPPLLPSHRPPKPSPCFKT
jgi:hypothetical protein